MTNIYPTAEKPFVTTFVKEQVESIRKYYPDSVIDVHVIKGEKPKWAYPREMLVIPGVVKKRRYDIVHAHFGLSLISLLLVHVPIIVTFHGSDLLVKPTKYVSRLLAPMASKVIVVSERLREALGYGEVIPCGINVKDFNLPASHIEKSRSPMPGKLKILFPADPDRKIKDYGLFQAVCLELERRGNKVEQVQLVNIEREKVREVYWNCDAMLLTSLSEGSPTVIKEAIASKLPFVSVDVGDVKEWTTSVDFGVVVPDRNPKAIADSLMELLARIKNRVLLDNSKCLEKMDMENIARRIMCLYEELLENKL